MAGGVRDRTPVPACAAPIGPRAGAARHWSAPVGHARSRAWPRRHRRSVSSPFPITPADTKKGGIPEGRAAEKVSLAQRRARVIAIARWAGQAAQSGGLMVVG